MTIKHVVLLGFKPELSQIEIEGVMQAIGDLRKSIPEIMSFSWGENNSIENLHQGYKHGFIMEFKDQNDRKKYVEHPVHVKVAQEIVMPAIGGIDSVVVFDYEG